MSLEVAIGLVALLAVGIFIFALTKLRYVATPSEVLIFAGNQYSLHVGHGRKIMGYRAICGGIAIRVPLLEDVYRMDLSNIQIDIVVQHADSKGGIPLHLRGVALVRLPGAEPLLSNAVERFLGRSCEEIAHVALAVIDGKVRGVLAQLAPEEVHGNALLFSSHRTHQIIHEVEHDFDKLGLLLDTLKVQHVSRA